MEMIPSASGATPRASAESFAELAYRRRTLRRYRPQAVDEASLERILLAATYAPSAHNRQPWRFAVIYDTGAKQALAAAMGARLREDRLRGGDDPDEVAADVARSILRIGGAPGLIVVCLTMAEMDVYADAARNDAEHLMAVQSVAMATQNALLAAHDEGLGACLMCAPLFCQDVVRRVLSLPEDWRPQGLITLGYPLDDGRRRARKDLSAVTMRIEAPADRREEA